MYLPSQGYTQNLMFYMEVKSIEYFFLFCHQSQTNRTRPV